MNLSNFNDLFSSIISEQEDWSNNTATNDANNVKSNNRFEALVTFPDNLTKEKMRNMFTSPTHRVYVGGVPIKAKDKLHGDGYFATELINERDPDMLPTVIKTLAWGQKTIVKKESGLTVNKSQLNYFIPANDMNGVFDQRTLTGSMIFFDYNKNPILELKWVDGQIVDVVYADESDELEELTIDEIRQKFGMDSGDKPKRNRKKPASDPFDISGLDAGIDDRGDDFEDDGIIW